MRGGRGVLQEKECGSCTRVAIQCKDIDMILHTPFSYFNNEALQ